MDDLISRHEVLIALHESGLCYDNWLEVRNEINAIPSAVCDDCIWNVCNYNKVDWDVPSADAVHGWIPVSEKLPETGASILVTYSDGEVGIVWSARPKVWGKYEEANNLIFPVAWMPLPKPYKGGDDK